MKEEVEEVEKMAEVKEQNDELLRERQWKKKRDTAFWGGIVTGLLFAVCIVMLVFLFTRITAFKAVKNPAKNLLPKEEASAITDEVTAKMKKIEAVIDAYYYQEDTDKDLLIEDAYKGMVASLGDPYSTYYSEDELNEIMESSKGIYYGIGAYVSLDLKSGYAQISGVIEGTPAEEVGLQEGDLIYEVDGKSAYGLELTEVVRMIKGEEGTTVHLTLVRDGAADYVEQDVKRRKIESPTVNYKMYDGQKGYIQITEFDDVTSDQFAEALAVLKEQGMKGLVLDLRSNPGGNLNTVVEIARMLLPKGMIVYTEDRNGNRQEYTCDGSREFKMPLVVLVNKYSASASEILAGAIQDYGIGTLLGTTTYGKGIVQQVISLKDGSAVKLTISSYYTPKGRNIHGIGIEPDEVYEFDGETYYNGGEKYDNQLERAKELLGEKMAE